MPLLGDLELPAVEPPVERGARVRVVAPEAGVGLVTLLDGEPAEVWAETEDGWRGRYEVRVEAPAEEAAPLPPLRLVLRLRGSWSHGLPADAAGRFELPAVPPGTWRVVAGGGSSQGEALVEVPPGGTAGVALTLRRRVPDAAPEALP